jgi:hypothetical protein
VEEEENEKKNAKCQKKTAKIQLRLPSRKYYPKCSVSKGFHCYRIEEQTLTDKAKQSKIFTAF